ncbi:AraC family transcriptional regulator [uncultured Clostridium sp.]|uniref:helix-turn-helix domain-containing protein n=1 Tax=uncultured Clostridium sp. TaxID=59620 RepID=UPI003452763A
MYDNFNHFISDVNIFSNQISELIKLRDKPKILKIIKDKQLFEYTNELSIENKRNDLIIWNAIYSKEIIKNGVATKYLHPIYNKFYNKISALNNLKDLQNLELDMVNTYVNLLIYDIEVTNNFVINKILKYLHLNIESEISLEKLAEDLNLSASYISSCFKKQMGISIMKYAKKIRIDRAKVLLTTTDISILDLSVSLGFYDQSHFSKTFKKFTGVSPSKYRNENFS